MSRMSLRVNGRIHSVDVDDDCPLLYVLRDNLGASNPRFGCGLGQCGACTVLVDNRAVRSCQLPVRSVAGKDIVTIEGLGTPEKPHPVQQAFIDEQSSQCGYCLNGWVMTAVALLDRIPRPTDKEIRTACEGLICRCGSHAGLFDAVRRAAGTSKSDLKRSA
jgi:nicotinate dehydrogenase subunit A